MVNSIILMGNLTKDAENKNGVTRFTLAIDKFEKGEKKVFYVEIRCFQKTAETCAQLTKGTKVLVTGKLDCAEWEKDGQKRRALYVIANAVEFLSPKMKPEEKAEDVEEISF